MTFIQEIHNQKPAVRYALFGFSVVLVISFVGFFWFTSMQRDIFMATHSDPAEQQAFLASQQSYLPQPLALISRVAQSLTASIGSLIGWDSSKGFDKADTTDHNQAAYPLPLSK